MRLGSEGPPTHCLRCEAPLPPRKPGPGRYRKYCSKECSYKPTIRKLARPLVRGFCNACGADMGECHPNRRFCSGACQKWAWCHPRQTRTRERNCDNCGQAFQPKYETSRFCSKLCGDVARGAVSIGPAGWVIDCGICGERKAVSNPQAKSCHLCRREWERRRGERWRRENAEKWRETNRRRDQRRSAQRRGRLAVVEDLVATEVYERDRWRCGLCGKKVRRSLRYPHPSSPSLDHVVPLSLGGDHTLANVQLAHWSCNRMKKTSAMNEQLRLVG